MHITSSAFEQGGSIPAVYTCDGKGVSPPLIFSDIPHGAMSLVLFFDDPDATIGTFDHLVIWNIPPSTRAVPEGALPQGVVGKNSAGGNAYFHPCPSDHEHRYFFKLFALDKALDLPKDSRKVDVEKAMEGHVLDSAELMGRYKRR